MYIPTLVCNSSMPCWDDSNGQWFPRPPTQTLHVETKKQNSISMSAAMSLRSLFDFSVLTQPLARSRRHRYDFPTEFEGYTESPSGLQLKDLGTRSDLANLIDKAPMPNAEEGTNSIEIFSAG